jgi:hypothetical protein
MATTKTVRVGVLFGFQHQVHENDDGEMMRLIHLPGAVIDLPEIEAQIEIARNRVVAVDPSTPLRDGHEPATEGAARIDFVAHSAAEIAARNRLQ